MQYIYSQRFQNLYVFNLKFFILLTQEWKKPCLQISWTYCKCVWIPVCSASVLAVSSKLGEQEFSWMIFDRIRQGFWHPSKFTFDETKGTGFGRYNEKGGGRKGWSIEHYVSKWKVKIHWLFEVSRWARLYVNIRETVALAAASFLTLSP